MKNIALRSLGAAAVGLFFAGSGTLAMANSPNPLEFLQQSRSVETDAAPSIKKAIGRKNRNRVASNAGGVDLSGINKAGRSGSLQKQHAGVSTGCLRPALRQVLSQISGRFGRPVVVTSGYRSPAQNRRAGGASRSYHMQCMAADIKVPGVSPGQVARFARSLPQVGGVGFHTYTSAVHIDVAPRVATWTHGRRNAARYAKRKGKRIIVAQR
jgi:uncharacterized protein YcbK (DUF882 family)